MNRLWRWLRRNPQLNELQHQRLDTWKNLRPRILNTPFSEGRCVVLDVESSGLNLMDDRLISIGAVAVVNGQISFGDSFYVVLQQQSVSHYENILLHGIGNAEQIEGVPAADALLGFLEYLRKDPLIAFHVTFDQTMIRRAIRQYLGISFTHPWFDMAYLMPALNPPLAAQYHSLDEWLGHFNIHNDARHNALADALVTAQLLQIALAQARKKNINNFSALADLEKAQRWVSGC
jgi:DNA polymerase-3 subunit epsilon